MPAKKKVTGEIKDAVTATEIEAKKAARGAARKTKEKAATAKAAVTKKAKASKENTAETAKAVADVVKDDVTAAAEKVKKPRAKKAPKAEIIIQSPMGGNITPEEVLAKVGEADQIYIRVDENKAYWVKGEETGSVELW